jgi:Ca-activated chloride channel homolog
MTTTTYNKPLAGIKTTSPDGQILIFPLKHTEVTAKIDGNISRVEVRQQFENPLTQPLEAVYVFPLPDEAAVDEMEIKIGDRTIKGNIKKRQEAQQIYQQAKQQGKTAGLLEQERDNIFTQSLANIKPGEQIDVIIRYSDSLKFEGGNYEFVFPMVVGPRFIPGNPIQESPPTPLCNGGESSQLSPLSKGGLRGDQMDTDEVPDASRITPPVLPPDTRSGHDINVTVEIDAGLPIQKIDCPSHRLNINLEGNITKIQLNNSDTIPNKDLMIRYQVAGNNTQSSLLTQTDQRGTHFALYLIPAIEYNSRQIVPKDVVFLMDTSGSQHGQPLAQCKALMHRFIEGLNPDDTFTIIDFSDVTTQLSSHPLNNTPANRQKAFNYIQKLQANGGTYLLNGIRAVLNYPAAQSGRLRSIVLLTDGYIGNEDEILAEVQQELKPGNRLYSFGVGSSVNRFLLNRLADVGRGTVQVVRYDEAPDPIADKFFKQINNPVLTNIEVKWLGNGEKPTIYPVNHPDLFAEQPLVLFGRIPVGSHGSLLINGVAAGGNNYEQVFDLTKITPSENKGIAQLWGRMKIKHLSEQMFSYETKDGVEEITETALDYQLLSKYTAFVAVSDDVRVNPETLSTTVNVPLEMPEGVSHEGVFGGMPPSPPVMMAKPYIQQLSAPVTRRRGFKIQEKALADESFAEEFRDQFESLSDKDFCGDVLSSVEPVPSSMPKKESFVNKIFGKREEKPQNHLEIVEVTGLDSNAIESLKQHLQKVKLPSGLTGEIMFEFVVENGRVKSLVVDDAHSSLKDGKLIKLLQRSLVSWQAPVTNLTQVKLKIRVQ